MKHEGPNSCQLKDMANVKVFEEKQTCQKPYSPDLSMQEQVFRGLLYKDC